MIGKLRRYILLAGLLWLSQNLLAADYEAGKQAFLQQDYARAIEILQPLAEEGNSQAQVTMGIIYDNGHGVGKNPEKAFEWYMMAAEQGFPIVQHQVAFKYLHGIGVAQDYEQAARWWELAANAGLADSQFNLGLMHYRGLGLQQNLDRARELFTAAAKQDHGHAQYSLAVMYAFGQGVEKNYEEAIKWFHKSAVQNVAQAQYNLGIFYENGFGITKNLDTAREWYEKAAAQGLPQAEEKLAGLDSVTETTTDADSPAEAESGTEIAGVVESELAEASIEPDTSTAAIEATGNNRAVFVDNGELKTESWVESQSADRYTLQIGSSVDKQGIIEFIRENRIADNAAYIQVIVNDVTRYSALYGSFASFAEARQAASQLPESLQKTKPWVRNFGILQKLIRDSRRQLQ